MNSQGCDMSKENKGNILIVEDDVLLSLVEERLLKKLGYGVAGKAVNGEDAVEKAKKLGPDAILMDISLKGEMDGVQAMELIREFSDVPVIYLSGNSDNYNRERAKKTRYIDYLVKPITADDLVNPLRNAIKSGSIKAKSDIIA